MQIDACWAVELMDFRVTMTLTLTPALKKTLTPTPILTLEGSMKIHIMIFKFTMEMFLFCLKRSLVRSKASHCKYA